MRPFTLASIGIISLAGGVAHVQAAPLAVDAGAEVATALYAAAATQAMFEKAADAKLRAQRQQIEALRAKVKSAGAQAATARAALVNAQKQFVADLAARDRAYAEAIAQFRGAVADIAGTRRRRTPRDRSRLPPAPYPKSAPQAPA